MLESIMLVFVLIIWLLILLFVISACVLAKRCDEEIGRNKEDERKITKDN